MPGKFHGVFDKTVQFSTGCCQYLFSVPKNSPMPRYYNFRVQALNQIQCRRYFIECFNAFKLWKHHAETALPKSIGGNQCLGNRLEEYNRMGIVAACCMNLPMCVAKPNG